MPHYLRNQEKSSGHYYKVLFYNNFWCYLRKLTKSAAKTGIYFQLVVVSKQLRNSFLLS